MRRRLTIEEVADEILQSILATPKRQRRLRSATLWDKFGLQRRTKERVDRVKSALRQRSIMLNIDEDAFGSESKDEWVVLSYVDPEPAVMQRPVSTVDVPVPPDEWFALIADRVFESEREVEYYLVVPLLEQLGYLEDDIAIGFPVEMYEGVKRVSKEADVVLFNGTSRAKEDALLIVEAKRSQRPLTEDCAGQARAYAMWLCTPYYVVTNGEDIHVYLFRGAVQPDVLVLTVSRLRLRDQWPLLYQTLNREAVVDFKAKLLDVLFSNREQR